MPNRKVTYSTAQFIRSEDRRGKSAPRIKRELNLDISLSCLRAIIEGRTYRNFIHSRKCQLSREQRKAIRGQFVEFKVKAEALAVKYEVSLSTIRRVIKGK